MSKKKFIIGIEDFKEYREKDYYYVDKTAFIRELIHDHNYVNLITRPRRFGKSFGLSTLKYFFEIDEKMENEKLFSGLNIAEFPEFHDHQGKYPVIHLTFKGAKRLTPEESINSICDVISEEYERHEDAVRSYTKRGEQVEAIRSYSRDSSYFSNSIYLLSKILYEYYQKKVIILIDEYDVPLENAFFNEFYEEMLDFIRALFESALKSNQTLEFAVLTGCLRVSKESVFTGLNNFTTYSTLGDKYSHYFGFTEPEVQKIIKDFGLRGELYDEIKEWYDGYSFGNTEIYNPWSVLQTIDCVLNGETDYLRPFWSNTSSNLIVRRLLERSDSTTTQEIEQLMQGETIRKPIDEDITYDGVYENHDVLWSFLYYTGYLTNCRGKRDKGIYTADLVIPNKEVHYIFETQIKNWIKGIIKDTDLKTLHQAVLDMDIKLLTQEIDHILLRTISYNDYRETFYHGLMMGLLTGIPNYIIKSNAESGLGRSDVTLKHASGRGKAIILEFKIAETESMLEARSKDALDQIENMKYDTELTTEGYREIIKYGISFFKKSCCVSI